MRLPHRFVCLVPLALIALTAAALQPAVAKDVETLAIGSAAPELDLPGVDGKTYKLADFAQSRVLVVLFTCNHCPTAQAYEERIMKLHSDFKNRGVALVAVSPNDPESVQLSELGYTDIADSFDEMKL